MSAALKAIDKLGYDKDEYEVLAKDFKEVHGPYRGRRANHSAASIDVPS